ncbi:HAD hydrolase family protein [Thomasclavelia sp.]|uniref:HAD hydrolase family protein n=1 Tax=Thomasclavelia sp. TaxID=3025757 RepID=UPI0025DFFB0A|nr:HAD hydrolase family protein [Thomasclavelia sp.]
MKKIPLPGLRIIKSSIAVAICVIVHHFIGLGDTPFYSAIATLWCMRPFIENSFKMAKQRILGTLIGAVYGFVLIILRLNLKNIDQLYYYLICAFLVGLVLYTTILFNKKETSYFSCVVFLSIVINHSENINGLFFVFSRTFDTITGIIVAIVVNSFRIPYYKNEDILFISGLDDTLLTVQDTLTSYSKIELNRMLEDGAKFTISTLRTPASIREVLQGIKLNLPVIAMDGAVLYDINNNHFEHFIPLKPEIVIKLKELLNKYPINYFTNVIIDDRLVIYYQDFFNPAEEKIYQQLKKNPYRHYIKQTAFENDKVVYIMIINNQTIIKQIYQDLKQQLSNQIKILMYPSKDYPGYYYLKIYDPMATRENMNEYLRKKINANKIITFGSIKDKYDILISSNNSNQVVRTLKKLYEPYFFKK